MFGKKEENVGGTKQADAESSGAPPSQSLSKEYEARAGLSDSKAYVYLFCRDLEQKLISIFRPLPTYQSLVDAVGADMHALQVGDPNETISVPMIHTREKQTFKTVFLGVRGKTTHTVVVRKMPRSHYLRFYAKDAEGNYIGTEKPAVDAGLVFVPSKSTPEDLMQQVRKVAFGKEHYSNDFGHALSMPGADTG